ncbi:MAG: hypothetical protein CVT60_05305 [Actinobacteria bacterium HGW-Actinobacteria-10]|jgi:predicted PurR-regulated permease PerM|nr:MAG: hypothetical protein CVT60_05305 [Actinobacteria bacterium HGW-Actinobacteria-10]
MVNQAELDASLRRMVMTVLSIVVLIWFLFSAAPVIFLFLMAVILALALDPPVRYLSRKMPRWLAALAVLIALGLFIVLLMWLLVPILVEQGGQLAQQIPGYLDSAAARVQGWAERQDVVPGEINIGQSEIQRLVPSVGRVLSRIGRFSITTATGVVLLLVLLASVAYMLINPRPLLVGYLSLFPLRLQEKAKIAFEKSSTAVSGWLWSNVIVGAIEGVAAGLFLWWIGVPAPLLWALLTFVSELIPKLGPYLMTIPPALIALSIDPMMALWVVLFFVVMSEGVGDTIAPMIRGQTMDLHPVSILFAVLALAAVFGFWGALFATPLAGIFKAYYETFWLDGRRDMQLLNQYVDELV